jgi:hypothetical protein
MEHLVITETETTPSVNGNVETGSLSIVGESFPNLAMRFYQPIMDWLQSYVQQATVPVTLTFKLSYFNTSSSKCIINLLMLMEDAHNEGKTVKVEWCYQANEPNMRESGEELAEGLTLPFTLVEH